MSRTHKRRVAAYARVSTDKDEQITSYKAQVDYYKKYIQNNEDWEFVDVYADEGITGTSTKSRQRFKEMIDDAVAGKIDLIITKSVSRACDANIRRAGQHAAVPPFRRYGERDTLAGPFP